MQNPIDTPTPATEVAADRYGVDHERERRLVKVFVGLIAAGFLIVLVMLGIAITLDVTIGNDSIATPPPVFEPSTAEQAGTPGSHP